MSLRSRCGLTVLIASLFVGGCCFPVREQVDGVICDLAALRLDSEPLSPSDQSTPQPSESSNRSAGQPADGSLPDAGSSRIDTEVRPAVAQAPAPIKGKDLAERLQIPRELPGATAPPIPKLPEDPAERKKMLEKLFPPLPALAPGPEPVPGPSGQPLTLADLQALALSNSPVFRQAAADVQAARGAATQAGAYPNPTIGYEADTIGTGPSAGYQGGFVEQLIKTGGKLSLAQAAATMDLLNAQLALRRAQSDLATQVRSGYFAVLVALENVKVTRALVRFSDAVYRIQVDMSRAGRAAPAALYEPMQVRVLAMQARGAYVQARNRYTAAWKQLAATLGLPALPPTELAGRVDLPIPVYRYDTALARVLSSHTDVFTAQNTLQKGRYNLRLAQITPVPDVDVIVRVQKDYTTPPFNVTPSVQVGVPVPLWNQNRGGIIQAQGTLLRATEESHRVRDDLSQRLAAAFEDYANNRQLLEYYRKYILPDQVRAYMGVYERYGRQPGDVPLKVGAGVTFGDVVTAQQTLATQITNYLTTLGAMWTAVVNVADLLQTNDLFQTGEGPAESYPVAPVPDLEHLPGLPCCHPCTTLPDPLLKGADGAWPPAMQHADEPPAPATPKKD